MMRKTKRSGLVLPLILSLALLFASGCIQVLPPAATSPPSTPPAAPPEASTIQTINATADVPLTEPGYTITLDSKSPPLPTIADVVAKVKPSVVAINTETTSRDIFNRPFTQEGAGSGWIIRENGVIVTNNHVVQGAQSITVTLDDGRTLPVDMSTVVTDSLTDLAVIRIGAKNLPAVTMGDSRALRLGEWVVAIGNSLDLGVTPSEGIVRTLRATVSPSAGQTLYDLIGTTAAINPGNSGGPLVNMAGEVIGITSAKISAAGVEGMGYAISSYTAKPVIESLMQKGFVVRPYLGVTLRDVDAFVVFSFDLAVEKGALIVNVAAGSPADRAGLRAGDVVTRFGDTEVTTVNELLRALHASQAGQPVTVTYWRDTSRLTVQVTLAETPPPSR